MGLNRVSRLMRRGGLVGVTRRRKWRTTKRDKDARPAPDLVQRDFAAEGPDQLWVADITYVPTGSGFLYVAVVVDAWSRRVVGWSMRNHLRTDLVLQALDMALLQRRPEDVIHHSDQGTQYTSIAFGLRCKHMGVRPSMGSVGDCYDNALCESFFATLECELIERRRFSNRVEAKIAVFRFIESWYNPRRRHSALGYESPVNFEASPRSGSMRNLRGQVALYSPAARGKLSSPQRGGHTINLSVHPSTETGQLQSTLGRFIRPPSTARAASPSPRGGRLGMPAGGGCPHQSGACTPDAAGQERTGLRTTPTASPPCPPAPGVRERRA